MARLADTAERHSMAAPPAAGVAALLLGADPGIAVGVIDILLRPVDRMRSSRWFAPGRHSTQKALSSRRRSTVTLSGQPRDDRDDRLPSCR